MRIPSFTQMTDEQKKLYLEVPLDGSTLVSGPPGTGKTVIALMRAAEAAKRRKQVTVGMFNHTLRAYVSRTDAEFSMPTVDTVYRIFSSAWYALRPEPLPSDAWVILDTPFTEKDQAKGLGAQWRKNYYIPNTMGVWVVPGATYRQKPAAFSRWRPCSPLPMRTEVGQERQIDWLALRNGLLNIDGDDSPVSWNHLIIDEGQDFPPAFYAALRQLSLAFEPDNPPALTVLADENQRLMEGTNSKVEDIQKELRVPDDRHFKLRQNFRNTRQIAKVAECFYCGAPTGKPDIPEHSGRDVELRRFDSREQVVDTIRRLARANDTGTIGVIVPGGDAIRQDYYRRLCSALGDSRVHTYHADGGKKLANGIPFDEPGMVLVINQASCKGLEFSSVFIVDMQEARIDQSMLDFFKMGMYVMCSRARDELFLTYVASPGASYPILAHLPGPELLKIKN